MRHLAPTEFLSARVWILVVALGSIGSSMSGEEPGQRSSALELEDELKSALAERDFESASRACEELIALEAGTRAPVELAGILRRLAEMFYATETPQGAGQAQMLFERALTMLEEALGRSDPALFEVIVRLADLHFEQGRFEESLRLDRRALEIRTSALGAGHRDVAIAERNLGVSMTRLAHLREAREHLERSVRIAERLDPADPRETAYSLKELAENLRMQNRYAEALPLLERAVALAEANLGPSDPDRIELLISLSGIYRDLNRFAESQWRHRQAWDVLLRSPEPSELLRLSLLNNEAEIRRFQGDAAGAERFYRDALRLSAEVLPEGHPWRATYMNQLALLLLEHKRYEEAEPLLVEALGVRTRALGSDHPELADTYIELGELYAASGRAKMALESLQTAISIRERRLGTKHPEVATALVALAETLESGESQREILDRAVSILRETPAEPRTLARALSLRSRLPGPGQIQDLTESLSIVERLRPEAGGSELTRSRFLGSYLDDYNRRVVLALEAGDPGTAFDYSEKRRSRSLLDQMAFTRVDLRAGIAPVDRARLEEREGSLGSRIAENRERLRILRDGRNHTEEIAIVEKELDANLEEFASLYDEIKNASRLWRGQGALSGGGTVTLSEFQERVVGRESLALVFVVGRESSYVITVPPSGEPPAFHRLEIGEVDAPLLGVSPGPLNTDRLASVLAPSPDTFNPALPEGLIADLASPPTLPSRNRRMPRQLHALFHVLIPPVVWNRIRRLEEAILIPDGILFQLPFDALVVDPGTGSLDGARYWLDDGPAIRYASSATLLANLERRPGTGPRDGPVAVSVSNPAYEAMPDALAFGSADGRLRPLPATALETSAIERAFGDARVKVLQGSEATEPRVRAALQGPPFVHLGTHGLVDPSARTLFASLALSPPQEIRSTDDDGWLELFEIYGLQLDAELAVLSACSTRAGSLVAGEGVFALSRGFLGAGARRVIASLWQVEDESTAALVASLFARIGSAPQGYARLLVDAKRSLREREEWAAPFFWAPFVLDGAR